MANTPLQTEIKSWLKLPLKKENLEDFSVKILGNSEKGDGYLGDIVFVEVLGKSNGKEKQFNFVLKCSKRSKTLRETSPVKNVFLNEIYMFENVHPSFRKFQEECNCESVFNAYPKFYGSFTTENMEVIILENLKKRGFELWPKKEPLTRKLIEMVVKEYGKYHAISAAMQQKNPEQFTKLVSGLRNMFKEFREKDSISPMFIAPIEESCELLKGDLDNKILKKWSDFGNNVDLILDEMNQVKNGLKVISHGDCWNNNFMYLFDNGNHNLPLKVTILDWQIARYDIPIMDLSYFLFACLSENDFESLDEILATYYNSFTNHLKSLGIAEPELVYSYQQFIKDWKSYCKYGILMSAVIMKVVSTDKDEVIDIAELAENGKTFSDTFMHDIKDKENFKKRIKVIIEYSIENNLI